MLYEFTLLGLAPNTLGANLPKLEARLPSIIREGRLLGCFTTEFGLFNRVAILTAYDSAAALQGDRAAMLSTHDPYGIGENLVSLERSAYRPFPFLEPVEPGALGPFYEIRTYGMAWGGMEPTIAGWADMVPKRNAVSKLLVAMESLELAPRRMVHIWPYPGLDARAELRRQAIAAGVWPPLTPPNLLVSMQTEMFVPTTFSPLK